MNNQQEDNALGVSAVVLAKTYQGQHAWFCIERLCMSCSDVRDGSCIDFLGKL